MYRVKLQMASAPKTKPKEATPGNTTRNTNLLTPRCSQTTPAQDYTVQPRRSPRLTQVHNNNGARVGLGGALGVVNGTSVAPYNLRLRSRSEPVAGPSRLNACKHPGSTPIPKSSGPSRRVTTAVKNEVPDDQGKRPQSARMNEMGREGEAGPSSRMDVEVGAAKQDANNNRRGPPVTVRLPVSTPDCVTLSSDSEPEDVDKIDTKFDGLLKSSLIRASLEVFGSSNSSSTSTSTKTGSGIKDDGNGSLFRNPEKGKCQFCFIDLGVGDGVMLQECLHLFCCECLQAAVEMQKENVTIPCPTSDETKCGGFLSDAEVKALVRPEVYQEYIDRSIKIAQKGMRNVFICKNKDCEGWCEFDVGRKTFCCPRCGKTNCLECGVIHSGVSCELYQTLSSTGQISKLNELIEKEQKSGWSQLLRGQQNGRRGMDPVNGIIQEDLLLNTMGFDCPICFCDIDEGEGVILQDCLHVFCKGCLINLVEFSDDPIVKCPYIDGNYSCICSLQPREIKALVPEAIYEKHLQRSAKLGESSIENSFHCKTPDCPGWCEYGEGARRFDCPICFKPNCIRCGAIHSDSCEDYKNRVQQNVNDQLSEKALEELIKKGEYMRCPKCKIPVQKKSGCDWLQCAACKTEICWVTRGPRWGPRGNGDISGGCRCRAVNGKKCHPNCGNCH